MKLGKFEMGYYNTAQVCLNGHAVTSDAEGMPEQRAAFCGLCGEATVMRCPGCNANIRGDYEVPGVVGVFSYSPPSYCHSCGKPLPWTARRIEAANEVADEIDSLSDDEKKILKESIVDLTRDTPKTDVASLRYKKFLKKAGSAAAEILNKIVVSVATEAAKKHLGL